MLSASQNGSVAPLSQSQPRHTLELSGDTAVFRYTSADGTLEYRWKKPTTAQQAVLGTLRLTAIPKDKRAAELTCLAGAKAEWTMPLELADSYWSAAANHALLTLRFRGLASSAELRLQVRMEGKALSVDMDTDRPFLRSLDVGGWERNADVRDILVPYDPFPVLYYPRQDLFAAAYFDWTDSQATTHAFPRVAYGALTNGAYNRFHERLLLVASWRFVETFPNQPHAPSRYLPQVAGRTVLDIWSGSFDQISAGLRQLVDYGLDNCIVLIHDWQRSGYDNALPAHYPAAAGKGGEDGLRNALGVAKNAGCFVALHENYVDYYPNYEGADTHAWALTSSGEPAKAWFNPGTNIQSFASKPTLFLKIAATESPEIHARYGTTASFLDVNSSVFPWWRADMDADTEGAGTFATFRDANPTLWAYLSATHGGPVFGEGNHHFFWAGQLDGVEAQAGSSANSPGPTAPLLVDFDLLRIHPLQANHGMGYYERWFPPQPNLVHPELVDAYRMQEVAFGHAPFLGDLAWSRLPMAWVETHLVSPVATRYGNAKVQSINYLVEGRWVDSDAAARTSHWEIVRMRYTNGLTVTANSSPHLVPAGDLSLPQYTWAAAGDGVHAYTALRQNVVVDYAETPESFFANARHPADIAVPLASVSAQGFQQNTPRQFTVSYVWKVESKPQKDLTVFVHFVPVGPPDSPRVSPLFQADYRPKVPTSAWNNEDTIDQVETVSIPDSVNDGLYWLKIGLYDPATTQRFLLEGQDDGAFRYIIGRLSIKNSGRDLAFIPAPSTPRTTPRWNFSGKLIDFGPLRTDGSIYLERQGNSWVLRPLNRDRSFTIEIANRIISPPRTVDAVGLTTPVRPVLLGNYWRLPLRGAGEYRWPAR